MGFPAAIAEMTIAALSSLTQKREAGDSATNSKMTGMTMMLASASRARYTLIKSAFRSFVKSNMLPKYFILKPLMFYTKVLDTSHKS
jgi:hypothetical protein